MYKDFSISDKCIVSESYAHPKSDEQSDEDCWEYGIDPHNLQIWRWKYLSNNLVKIQSWSVARYWVDRKRNIVTLKERLKPIDTNKVDEAIKIWNDRHKDLYDKYHNPEVIDDF